MNYKKYYLGIDAGTDSVGYAVTDDAYSILKFHGEPMWGVSLFEEAALNTDRRTFRTARRRTARRQQRVSLLQELFAKEIAVADDRFFVRLQSSRLYRDKTTPEGSLFPNQGELTDRKYHSDYPTIHHLLCDLMNNKEKHDVRLVYLACAWLISHRGHFLSEINTENIAELKNFSKVYSDLTEYILQTDDSVIIPWQTTSDIVQKISDILTRRNTISGKYRNLCQLLWNAPKAPKAVENFPYHLETFLKLLCGSTVKASDLFANEEYADIPSFALDSDDEKLAEVFGQLGDDASLLIKMKAVTDCTLLVNSLNGFSTISEAKVKQYEQHKEDLALLKRMIRKYASKEVYDDVFRTVGADNYTAYSCHCKTDARTNLKKTDKIKFNDYLKKVLEKITPDSEDEEAFAEMKKRVSMHVFLPKQKDTDNRVIPHQLYQWELREILANASTYLPFLTEKDETGISVSEKIESIFTFKIPYFVGPLNPYCKERAWVVFKPEKNGRILPWNYFDFVDEEASEREFIRRMTNRCTYLPSEDVLPKDSLLYHRFTVLNEINNLEINGVPISVETKQGIYNDLFLNRRKVTVKAIKDYLISRNEMKKEDILTGIDDTVKSDLKPWLDFKRLLESGTLTEAQIESIIEHRTFAEEKPRFTKWLRREYGFLSDEDIAYISKLNYKDFGRLSRRFLNELEGLSVDSSTGEVTTILRAMWETNNNLMELLSDRFTFAESIADFQKEFYGSHSGSLNDRLNEMYISNAVKRPVIRTLEIVKEVTKAVGNPPAKIFVEMARGGKPEDKGKRTKSRLQQILELYDTCDKEDVRLLRQELEAMGEKADSRLQGDRLFLYYMQLGKCMYSGEKLDLSLLSGTTYNIEHIYPQAYVKDDSILNNEVLVKSELNGEKSDAYPIQTEIRHKMAGYWVFLHDKHLITDEKYKRLTRSTPFSDDEKWGFINRQLTETSQSTKAIATLLKEYYPDTEIVYVKARLASEFRQEFDLLKSRTFNDLHHAKDAYLNIVAGNVYNTKFTKNFKINSEYSIKTKTLFTRELPQANWEGSASVEKVKSIVVKNTAHLTKYAFCRHGGFFDQMPVKADVGLVPLKKDLPTERYGGYNKPTVSFFVLAKYKAGKKSETMLMPVELLYQSDFLVSEEKAAVYAKKRIGQIINKEVDEVVFPLGMRILKINTVLSLDGFKVCLAGCASGGKCVIAAPFMPFSADHSWETYIKRLEVLCEKVKNRPHYIFDAAYDKVTPEKNVELYRLYMDKLEKSIYKKRPNSPLTALINGQKTFEPLSEVEQAKVLLNIHQTFGRVSGGFDLTAIGGVARAGATVSFSSSLSNWKRQYSDVRIIDTSASGLWEKRSENLLDLL